MMSSSRALLSTLVVFSVAALSACTEAASTGGAGMEMSMGNPITGEGIANPAPNVTIGWGTKPAGREWGSTAGVDIDPNDGHVWAYERCSGNFGQPCVDNNDYAPIFKFDRNTGEILANFGAGIFVTP
ncbi:MAG: hypothetical protein OEO79_12105, partial [Gemmatimonadota bacterium]|nr:hypothetical protein [Gemmatimonadota bacterium]